MNHSAVKECLRLSELRQRLVTASFLAIAKNLSITQLLLLLAGITGKRFATNTIEGLYNLCLMSAI